MKKYIVAIVILILIALAGLFSYKLLTKEKDEKETENNKVQSEETNQSEDDNGPIPFSKVGKNIMDAKDDYDHFTFENGEGTCLDQGFPTDLIYTSKNVIKTKDDSYIENWTMVDFMGVIRFDELPLLTGSASCKIETHTNQDRADLTCTVDNVEVCTASFDVFAYK